MKDKDVSVRAIRVYVWSKGIAPSILSLGVRWRYVVNITSWLLYHRETTLVPAG